MPKLRRDKLGMKVIGDTIKHHRGVSHIVVKQDITKGQFLANLGKVCQPISKESEPKSDLKKIET
jgi:hypothetical protein